MENNDASHFTSIPWAAALINDPKWTCASTNSRVPKASGEDSLLAEVLATDRTIQAFLTLRSVEEADDNIPFKEIVGMVKVGDGLNGFPDVLHGGIAATLLDDMCGTLLTLNTERNQQKSGSSERMHYMTAYLNTSYRKPIPTPGVLMLSAKAKKEDGRKLWISSTIEDGNGAVYTVGEALFIRLEAKL
ncbi:HotDog domain-containing protein [Phaeosphaeriaceae sp. PMI808]|nr:HotDog domain-containing protein [Phaeosphaeriaceae sp. PMI808]